MTRKELRLRLRHTELMKQRHRIAPSSLTDAKTRDIELARIDDELDAVEAAMDSLIREVKV